jgi:hypothetical protein
VRGGTQDATVRRCRDDGRRSERDRHFLLLKREEPPKRYRCSARKVARGGLNAEGGIVGGDKCELGFRVAVRSASRSP